MTYQNSFLLFFAVLTIFRFYFSAHFDLTPDEAYYWFWSRHPSLGYFDHPPMVAWMIKCSTALFGDKELAVRLPAMIMGIADTWLVFMLGKKIFKSEAAGILGALILNSLLIFSTGMVVMTPDSPQLFFWILSIYFIYIALLENRENYWFLSGIAFGMGLLSKYTMIFLIPSVLLFLLLTPEYRHQLFSLKIWIALLLAVVIFSPVILWNYQNHWISFLFQAHHGLDHSESAALKHLVEFLGSQAGIFSPMIFLGFFWALWHAFRIGKRKGLRQFSFIFWTSVPVFVFFLLNSFRISVGPNWPVFGQAGSILLLGGFFARKLKLNRDSFWTNALVIFSISLSYVLMMLVHIQAFSKVIPLRAEVDRTNDLIGWRDIQVIYQKFPETVKWPVITNSHTMVGEASFYLKNARVYQMEAPFRITDITRDNSERMVGESFLLITFEDDPFSDKIINRFKRVVPLMNIPVSIESQRHSIPVRIFRVFKGEYFLNSHSNGTNAIIEKQSVMMSLKNRGAVQMSISIPES